MFVKQIKEFDCDSGEADVIVTDGKYELTCYCHPAESIVQGEKVKEIASLFAEKIMRVDSNDYLIDKGKDAYSYYFHGKVIDTQKPVIGIGQLRITLDKPLAKDIMPGEFVELKVERLNCSL